MLAAFLLGWRESDGSVGMTYDDNPESPRSQAYDTGRNLRRHAWAVRPAIAAGMSAARAAYAYEMER